MKPFPKQIKIGNRVIGAGHPTYLIAEIGANFDGNIDKAKRLIDAAKESGADCAKFQTFITERIVSEGGFSRMKLEGVHGSWGRTVSEVLKRPNSLQNGIVKLLTTVKKLKLISVLLHTTKKQLIFVWN